MSRCSLPCRSQNWFAISARSRRRSRKKPGCGSPGRKRLRELRLISTKMLSANSASVRDGWTIKFVRLMRLGRGCASREENEDFTAAIYEYSICSNTHFFPTRRKYRVNRTSFGFAEDLTAAVLNCG